jgi:hypothetical protein
MDKLLKEAIADAKAVRETALANAKLALEEAFAPKLQSMLSAKLNEEDDEMEDEEDTTDEGTGMNPGYMEGETEEDEMEEAAEEGGEEAEETEEALDLEAIIRELEMEAKGEDEEEAPAEEEPKTEAADEDEEEVNLDELLASLSEADDEDEEKMDEAKDDEEEKEKMDELKNQLEEYRQTVVFLKSKINEINLLNAKLLYTNKLFRNFPLTESQKVKILESLDRTKSVREVKLVYSTLTESLNEIASQPKKKITESLGLASKPAGKTQKAILEEGSSLAARFQTLANINRKK